MDLFNFVRIQTVQCGVASLVHMSVIVMFQINSEAIVWCGIHRASHINGRALQPASAFLPDFSAY